MKKFPAITVFCLLTSACGIYTDYQRPEMPVVDSLYTHLHAEAVSNDSSSIAFLPWEELFADSLLRGYIRTGLENNTDLNIARLKVEEAEATLDASRRAFLPSVSADAGLSVSTGGSSFSVSPSVQWEIDAFGKLRNTRKGAEAALEQSRAYTQAVRTQLIATIADSYYTLLMLDQQMEISRRTMATWEENIRSLSALKRAGKKNIEKFNIAVIDTIFSPRKLSREDIENLRYIPFTNNQTQFLLEAARIVTESKVEIPVVECRAPYKMYLDTVKYRQEVINLIDDQVYNFNQYAGLKFGSLEGGNNEAGNWGE